MRESVDLRLWCNQGGRSLDRSAAQIGCGAWSGYSGIFPSVQMSYLREQEEGQRAQMSGNSILDVKR